MSVLEVLRKGESWIEKAPGVCGGRARIRRLRIPVWSVVRARQLGFTDEELLNRYGVPLTLADLDAAWAYHALHPEEIERDLQENTPTD